MLKNFKKRKQNNKGFTLVELVVVIAILAILVGLLVPQYTKYVDKARKSSDASNLANMVRAVEIAAADPNGTLKPEKITITVTSSGATATVAQLTNGGNDTLNTEANIYEIINNTMGENTIAANNGGTLKLKSTSWNANGINCEITIKKDYSFNTKYSEDVKEYIAAKDNK